MAPRFALCTSLTIALLAFPAGALAADVVVPSSVAGSTTVPAGGSSTLTLHCPSTAVALNAAITRRGAGVTVRRSIPGAASGDWRFRLAAAADARRRGVRAVLRCVRLALPVGVSGARLVVGTRRSPAFAIASGSFVAGQANCRAGFVPTGYGLDSGARGDVKLAAAIPTAAGWSFTLENTGTTAARARFTARCLRRTVNARAGGGSTQTRFRTARRSFGFVSADGGAITFSHRCGANQFSLATGSSVDPGASVELGGSAPTTSRAGRWTFRRASAGDRGRTFLVCLSRRTRFG